MLIICSIQWKLIIRINKSPFLKSYLHKVDAKTHLLPLFPLWNTHTHDTHNIFNCTHIRITLSPLNVWTYPLARVHRLQDGQSSWLVDLKREDQTPPTLARVMAVSRPQQQQHMMMMLMVVILVVMVMAVVMVMTVVVVLVAVILVVVLVLMVVVVIYLVVCLVVVVLVVVVMVMVVVVWWW